MNNSQIEAEKERKEKVGPLRGIKIYQRDKKIFQALMKENDCKTYAEIVDYLLNSPFGPKLYRDAKINYQIQLEKEAQQKAEDLDE